jgi:hypothetical protein
MMMLSMRDFLQRGHLGQVQLGLRPEQVIAILGDPDARTAKRRPLQLLRYGAVEFGFIPVPGTTDSRMVSVAVYFSDPDRRIPQLLRPDDWLPTSTPSQQDFREFLERTGIDAHFSAQGEQEYLTLDSGARVVFSEGRLHSIHFQRKDRNSQRRQMTVSLPEELVERLQHRAQEEGVAVQELIEQMIKAGA